MKRSEMVKRMTEQWLGLWKNELPGENIDNKTYNEVYKAMDSLLIAMEFRGMKPPALKESVLLHDDGTVARATYEWEKQEEPAINIVPLTLENIEDAAARSAMNMGPASDLYYPKEDVWLVRNGKFTEEGLKIWAKLKIGERK